MKELNAGEAIALFNMLNAKAASGGGKPEETKSVPLSMASGNQVILPTDGSVLTEVTVEKPDTLIPENVKKDVDIGGVVGTLESGGGINGKVFTFIPTSDVSKTSITITAADDVIAQHINDGSLLVVIQDTVGGYQSPGDGYLHFMLHGNIYNGNGYYGVGQYSGGSAAKTSPTKPLSGSGSVQVGSYFYVFSNGSITFYVQSDMKLKSGHEYKVIVTW